MSKSTVLVREYNDAKEFSKDAQKLAKDGWAVSNTTQQDQGRGVVRALALGPFAKKKSKLVVTYMRTV